MRVQNILVSICKFSSICACQTSMMLLHFHSYARSYLVVKKACLTVWHNTSRQMWTNRQFATENSTPYVITRSQAVARIANHTASQQTN